MNARQKEVLEQSLKDEQAVLDALTKNYTSALADIRKNIRELQANPLTQSKAYQLEYQKQLEKQISGVLDNLQGKNFNSIASYLQTCYETGFVGNMYDMQGQGVPLVIPIDEGQVLKAVQKTGDDFKLSDKLSGNTTELKKQVKSELQRGFASQLSYADIARNISNYGQADMNRSMRIARTEGHRVQSEARLDSMYAAKKKGADIVKQWDATLDGQTRPNHRQLDGQIRELDEPFEVGGMKVDCPGGFGIASEDCNCRCCVLQRARWAVKNETTYQKWNNETGGFIETTGYQDFKNKYLDATKMMKDFDISEEGKYKPLPFSEYRAYQDYIQPEYDAQNISVDDRNTIWAKDGGYIQNADGYKDINGYMRRINDSLDNPKCQKTIDVMKNLTSTRELEQNYIGYRKVSPSYISDVIGINTSGKLKSVGLPWEGFNSERSAKTIVSDINKIVGTEKAIVFDDAFTSISLCKKINFFKHRPVEFQIQMPSGTKGLITDNWKESEFITKPGTGLEILGAREYNNNGNVGVTIFAKIIQD